MRCIHHHISLSTPHPSHATATATGWERHASRSDGALFLHNPGTGESVWFTGWVEKTSKWYGRNYWFQPTTGRSEWELPSDTSAPWKEPTQQERQHQYQHQPVESTPVPSTDVISTWKAKIAAAKAKAAAAAEGAGGDAGGNAEGDGGAARGATRKRNRSEGEDGSSSDDMEVDEDVARGVEMTEPPEVPPPPPAPARLLEDIPSVSLRRETLRRGCLERFANENSVYGKMTGYTKTSKSCRDEGMAKGLSGMFGRWVLTALLARVPAGSVASQSGPVDPQLCRFEGVVLARQDLFRLNMPLVVWRFPGRLPIRTALLFFATDYFGIRVGYHGVCFCAMQ